MKKFNLKSVFEPKIALPLITLIALIFRLVSLRYKYLFGYDPYFHLTYIEESIKTGYWINFYHLANAPWGILMETSWHPLGFYATPLYFWKLLGVFGVSLYTVFRITPVFFGVLTIVFFYLAMITLYGKREAFFSTFFLSVMFGHAFRSMANYYRGDNYMLFWYSIALFGISIALKREGRKKLLFYLIPALASGLASAFWSAYYPIFVFLLVNAVLLSIGAFILEKKRYLLDSVALTLATAVGALIANYLGKSLRYGMLGGNKWLVNNIAGELGLKLGIIKDLYLLVHLKYLVPLSLILVLMLFLFDKVLESKKQRFFVVFIVLIIGIFALFKRFDVLKELSLGFGIFKELPILETRHSTVSDLWTAYNIALFLVPPFILRFSPKRVKLEDFLLLGVILPSLYMIYTWTRFLFIGSMAVAAMAGLSLVFLHNIASSKIQGKGFLALSVALLLILPTLSGAFSFNTTMSEKPLINENWEKALTWLGKNSNENDIILAWWDYGAWIEYYSRRGTVAQMSPNTFVPRYLLGNITENQLMERGVDYVIVSYYDFLKFGAIVDMANALPKEYSILVLPMVSSFGAFIFQRGNYKIVAKPGETWEIMINVNGRVLTPREAYLEYKGKVEKLRVASSNSNTYLYINLNYGYAVLMNEKAFNTTLARLFIKPGEPYETVYSDGGIVKILKLKHPNVAMRETNGTTVFKFENATGTGLGIWGYLDNGTLVFKKWYNVEGLKEFKLPDNLNGSVVVRYTYVQKKKVLDRGIFRVP